jgi:hypothetical protein
MDKWRLCLTQNNVKALWGMLMKSWTTLGFDGYIICSKHNTSGEGCNCKFNNLFLGVWCVIKFGHLSMHLHFTYNPYQLWGLVTDGVWIFLAHWIWYLDIINIRERFSKWLELVPLPNRSSEKATYAFLDRVFNRFGLPIEVLTDQGTKLCGEFQELCEKALIDHCMISWDHPKVDRLVEWMV